MLCSPEVPLKVPGNWGWNLEWLEGLIIMVIFWPQAGTLRGAALLGSLCDAGHIREAAAVAVTTIANVS